MREHNWLGGGVKGAVRAKRWRLSGNSVSYLKSRSLEEGGGHVVHVVNIKQSEDKRGYMWSPVIDPYCCRGDFLLISFEEKNLSGSNTNASLCLLLRPILYGDFLTLPRWPTTLCQIDPVTVHLVLSRVTAKMDPHFFHLYSCIVSTQLSPPMSKRSSLIPANLRQSQNIANAV